MTPQRELPQGIRLRVCLAAENCLSSLRRLAVVGAADAENEKLLADARRFAALELSLIERAQTDLVFWRIEQRLVVDAP